MSPIIFSFNNASKYQKFVRKSARVSFVVSHKQEKCQFLFFLMDSMDSRNINKTT
jgi:hypothetical protein